MKGRLSLSPTTTCMCDDRNSTAPPTPLASIRKVASGALTSEEVRKLRSLLWRAFADDGEGFTEDDWSHALGGWHVVAEDGDVLLSHASVIRRTLEIDGKSWDTGYVEAVASDPAHQNEGFGTLVMNVIGAIIQEEYELGALGTGSFHFYERLGWRRWQGPSGVRTLSGVNPTSGDDGFIMVLLTPKTSGIELGGLITCNWRQGDVW